MMIFYNTHAHKFVIEGVTDKIANALFCLGVCNISTDARIELEERGYAEEENGRPEMMAVLKTVLPAPADKETP